MSMLTEEQVAEALDGFSDFQLVTVFKKMQNKTAKELYAAVQSAEING